MESTAGVWPVSAEKQQRLVAALDRRGVYTAALLEPRAQLEGGRRAELEIAVWLDPDRRYLRRVKLRLDLLEAAEEALDTDMVDVLVLNHTSDLLRERARREAIPILDRTEAEQALKLRFRRQVEHLADVFARAPRPPKTAW